MLNITIAIDWQALLFLQYQRGDRTSNHRPTPQSDRSTTRYDRRVTKKDCSLTRCDRNAIESDRERVLFRAFCHWFAIAFGIQEIFV